MKGVIVNCLGELITEKFGKDKWEEALAHAGNGQEINVSGNRKRQG